MTALRASPFVEFEENEHQFIATFMSHVAAEAGFGENRVETIALVKTLLLDAIEGGAGSARSAWSRLHRAIDGIVKTSVDAPGRRQSRAYLQSFVRENADLAP